jgi:alkylation response protein AidB-like acyl-CoA dehydrogenase
LAEGIWRHGRDAGPADHHDRSSRIAAPQLPAQGLRHIGPILIEFGTEAQKAKHLPPILGAAMLLSSLLGIAAAQHRRYVDIAEPI